MKTGHFYFGKNRTFLNWLDTHSQSFLDLGNSDMLYQDMKSRRTRHLGFIIFVIYFSLLVIVPVTHSHAHSHTRSHAHSHTDKQCCETHERNHHGSDESHTHFLLDDQSNTRAKCHPADSLFLPQMPAAVDVVSFNHFMSEGFVIVLFCDDFYQESALFCFSGLSPPIS